MTDTTVNSPAPRKRRGWLKAIAWVFGILIALVVVVYFVATSGAFFKGVILPRMSKAMNAQVTVSDASISPFSQVILRNLKVQTTGADPLVAANEVRLRYSLMDIIRGNIHVDEVALVSPTIVLVQNPDGSSNLDPILKAQQAKPGEQKPAPALKAPGAKPLQLDLRKIALTDGTVRTVKIYANGARDVTELSHVNVTLDDLKNGQTGKLGLAADVQMQQTNCVLQAKLSGNYTIGLAADLQPTAIKGSTSLNVTRAEGALAQAAGFGSVLDVDVAPTDIKGVVLQFKKGDARLGELRVSGPFDMQKLEGRLTIALGGIDKQLLNLAGAKTGLDFGGTTISSTNLVELTKGGSMIAVTGRFDLNGFQVTRQNQTTPRLDLRKEYDVTVDRPRNLATLRSLSLSGAENGKAFLQGGLTGPMQIPLGSTNVALVDSTWTMVITNFDLADWKPFLGDMVPSGIVNTTAKIRSQQSNQQIALALDSRIDHLAVNAGSNHVSDMTITLHSSAQSAGFSQFNIAESKLEVAHANETLTTVTAAGTYDRSRTNADIQVAAQAALAPLIRMVPQPNMAISSGAVELKTHVTQQANKQSVTGNFALTDFTGQFGTNAVRSLGAVADYDIGMASQQVQIRKFTGKLTQAGNAAGSFDMSGTYDSGTTNADVQATAQLALATLFKAVSMPGLTVSSGTVELKTHMTQRQKTQAVTGNLALADFSARFGTNELRSLGTTVDYDVGMTAQQAQIRKFTGKLTQGANAGGSFDVSGTYDLIKTNGNFSAKLVDFNQNGLGPFLQPALGDKKLVSIAINANANAQYDPQAVSALKADLQVTNLVVKDPKGQFPATPLEARMQVDASLQKQVANIRQFQVTLTPTVRATNQVQLSGQIDMTQTNAIQGNLKLVADSLDFTSYYDLFMGAKPAAGSGPAASPASTRTTTPTPAATAADANKEPDAVKLPVRNFTADSSIRRLYLHEIEIDDWQTTTKIDGGHVVINPFKLTLNGAPASTTLDLDLGVPGWKYNWALNAQAIPLAPLVNSFLPDRKGLLSGTLSAQAKVDGAGITGASLQTNLTAQFDMVSTNLNLSVDNIQGNTFYTRLLKTLVSTIAVIPELAKNPASTATSLLSSLSGIGGGSTSTGSGGGLTADLKKSPINAIVLHGTAGSGTVKLPQAEVQSPAFDAQAHDGTVTLAAVLTNSPIQIPISLSLERAVAQRINMAGNTPTNATYAKLPDFLTMKGTLGNSKADIDKVALASAVLQGVGGKGGQAGGALQSINSLFSKGTNAPSTTGTNQPGGKVGGLLQGILGNSSPGATNAPATTNQSPANKLLDGLFGPKKK
jgi:uncharacterized protein involved in outer membrane biogenesis